jgi:hypothetical protein
LLKKIQEIDTLSDSVGLVASQWEQRYILERELVDINKWEEIFWSQRTHVQWLQEGDSNTAFFHAYANGRRRKCSIFSLEGEHGAVYEGDALQKHIYDFYKKLFHKEQRGGVGLQCDVWSESQRVSAEDKFF